MKKALLVSYHFPPSTSIGARRPFGLYKYLERFGWEIFILTPSFNGAHIYGPRIIETDYSDKVKIWKKRFGLDSEISVNQNFNIKAKKNTTTIIDKLFFYPNEIITYPCASKGWLEDAISIGMKIINDEEIDIVVSTSPPIISHIIAEKLAIGANVPWIADLRDLWTQNHYRNHNILRNFLEKKIETGVLSNASCITTTTKPFAINLKKIHKPDVYVILNGFDPDELAPDSVKHTNLFTITYTGSLYGGKRDPSLLFQCISKLIINNLINKDLIEIRFFGSDDPWLFELSKMYNLENVVRINSSVNRELTLQAQRESQLLLLLLWDNPDESGVCPAKIFEYMAARRPIIALNGPDSSVVADILRESQTGHYVKDLISLETAILYYYNKYIETGFIKQLDGKNVMIYSQLRMAKEFAEIFNRVSSEV
jgi:glycosyltransferase involved in cell wall biosynthesis